jgi:DNA-binding NarL/FixJ family response regulator
VIVFSGFSTASVGAEVIGLGAVLYLQKGASPEAITGAIEYAAGRVTELNAVG